MSAAVGPAAEHPEQWSQLHTMLAAAAAVDTAGRLGILGRLQQAPATAGEIAQHCATAPDLTGLLLDALDALNVVRRSDDGRYTTTSAAQWLSTLGAGWSHLDQVVRTGQPLVSADSPAGAAELYPEFVAVLSRLLAPAVGRAAELLAPVHGEVLDVGAGAAPWSIALAVADPTVQVTALDLPAVLQTTRRAVQAAGLGDRFGFHAGDMFSTELPHAAYDLIILGNVCHLFSPDANRALLRRLRPALRDGGTLAIVDALPSTEPEERRWLSLYSLGLRMRTSAGAVYPLPAYASWAGETGYGSVTAMSLSRTPPLALISCTAPGG